MNAAPTRPRVAVSTTSDALSPSRDLGHQPVDPAEVRRHLRQRSHQTLGGGDVKGPGTPREATLDDREVPLEQRTAE